jgi:YHS domain-containing protein
MSASGLMTEIIFQALGLIPGAHHHEMSMNHVGMNYTTVLNVLFLCILAIVYFLYKSRPADADSEFAQDPICGMQVRKDDAPAQWEFEGVIYYFCMQGCKDEFMKQKTA